MTTTACALTRKVTEARFDLLIQQITDGRTTFDACGPAYHRVTAEAQVLPHEIAAHVRGTVAAGTLNQVRTRTYSEPFFGSYATNDTQVDTEDHVFDVKRMGATQFQSDSWLRKVGPASALQWMRAEAVRKLREHATDRGVSPINGVTVRHDVEIFPPGSRESCTCPRRC